MNLSEKDFRAIEIYKKLGNNNLSDNLIDYHFFVDTLMFLNEALVENKTMVQYWQQPSETLLYKFTSHCLAIHQLLTGFKIHSQYYSDFSDKNYIDISSAKVVFRSQFESFLMYHHIYVNPDNDDLKELRYNAWMYSGLLQRQSFPSTTQKSKVQKEIDAVEMEKFRTKIKNLYSYNALTEKQQQKLFDVGSGKLFSHWASIMKETGFSEKNLFNTIYNHLSMFSHSEGLSIIQLSYQSSNHTNIVDNANIDLRHSKLLVCAMISSLCKLFPEINEKFKKLPAIVQYDIQIYTMMALSDINN